MYRNLGSRFSQAPQASIKRSILGYKHTHKTTFNAGDLVPIFVSEVLPGDTFDINVTSLVRLATPIHPTMDNLFLDTYFFFVPNRLIWDNFTKFMGENDQAWAQDTDSFVPPYFYYGGSSGSSSTTWKFGSVFDGSVLNYLGIPIFSESTKKDFFATCLDFNAYEKVFNDWFRDENYMDEVPIYKGDGPVPASYINAYSLYIQNTFGYLTSSGINESNSCLKASRFHDYFSSALPQPQKGPDVLIPAGGPVILDPDWINNSDKPYFEFTNGNVVDGDLYSFNSGSFKEVDVINSVDGSQLGPNAYNPNGSLLLDGLQITVNNLRLAIQTQKLLEADSRGGTRYTEIIYSHFGVQSPDARLQRSEYLGGKRTLLNMDEVIQTSASSGASPLGNLAGRSVTATNESGFVKSFTEHGYIIGLAVVRNSRTYSQGLPKRYFRFNRLQYYWSELANIGEQPILNKEIFIPGVNESVNPDDVFGYQEAWAEYRYTPDRLSGKFSPDASSSLLSWTYGDYYTQTPAISGQWLAQGRSEIDRTIAIVGQPQFIADFYFHGKAVRPMPVFSVPGLMDHH